jgi:hypothetical protein
MSEALDPDDIEPDDHATRALNELVGQDELTHTDEVSTILSLHWDACRNASVLLALADRLALRGDFLAAAIACAHRGVQARSARAPALQRALAVAESITRGEPGDARAAGHDAYSTVSRNVAGPDDDIGLAVSELCELCAGERYELFSTDPAFRVAWALQALADGRDAYQAAQRELADIVRRHVRLGSPRTR